MRKCETCKLVKDCVFKNHYAPVGCKWHQTDQPQPPQPITNGDKLRKMSDEELAKTISQTGCGLCTALGIRELCRINNDMACEDIIWKWLKQPAQEETT